MFDATPHRRVALVALAALVALSGAVAGAPVTATADVSPTEIDRSPASVAETATPNENGSATVAHDGARLTVYAAADQEIRGETTAEPGTELIIVLESANGSFSEPERATVREDGTFAATFDLREMDSGSEFAVVVRKNGSVLGRETGARALEPPALTAEFVYEGERLTLHPTDEQSVRMRTNADPGSELTVELRVDGAFVSEARAPVADDGTATATFDLRQFDSGTEFAVVAPDGTRADGVVVEASNETTHTATTHDESEFAFTTAATTTATDAPTDGGDTTDGNDGNDGTVPGLGVPMALIALLAALAVARQRGA